MDAPFVHPINVTWGDCDPAKIVYTGKLPGFALQAINAWWEAHFDGMGWYQMELDHNVGTPFVKLGMEFHSPVTPRHMLMCETCPTRLGTKSITFSVNGSQNGKLCFTGSFTCVFTVADAFKSQPAPADMRAVIEPLLQPDGAHA
ncbi:MAG: thioesterase family protein [Sulfitobacter sp.]